MISLPFVFVGDLFSLEATTNAFPLALHTTLMVTVGSAAEATERFLQQRYRKECYGCVPEAIHAFSGAKGPTGM